jgi:hypothetical protein
MPPALPELRTNTPSLFDHACANATSFANQDWGFCSGWSTPMETGNIYAFPAPKPSSVESHSQGMTEYAAFRVPLRSWPSDTAGGGRPRHNHQNSSRDIRVVTPCAQDANAGTHLLASSEM